MKNKRRRYRLSDYQAANLGLELKKINRYSLTLEQEEKHLNSFSNLENTTRKSILIDAFNNQDNLKPLPKNIKISKTGKRVLVIGDLHEPFCLDGYLNHCTNTYKKYKCDTVVFIGDIIDSHFSSFH
jgi:UDP-N-acetylmuramyl pentapeptide synthase